MDDARTDAYLAVADYRRHGAGYELSADRMALAIDDLLAVAVAACHDDSEQCTYCAWPEHSAAVLAIGPEVRACREHIWRALESTLGVRDREVCDEQEGAPTTLTIRHEGGQTYTRI